MVARRKMDDASAPDSIHRDHALLRRNGPIRIAQGDKRRRPYTVETITHIPGQDGADASQRRVGRGLPQVLLVADDVIRETPGGRVSRRAATGQTRRVTPTTGRIQVSRIGRASWVNWPDTRGFTRTRAVTAGSFPAASSRAIVPPIECPTRHTSGSPRRRHTSRTAPLKAAMVYHSQEGFDEAPWPGRSRAKVWNVEAKADCVERHMRDELPHP